MPAFFACNIGIQVGKNGKIAAPNGKFTAKLRLLWQFAKSDRCFSQTIKRSAPPSAPPEPVQLDNETGSRWHKYIKQHKKPLPVCALPIEKNEN